MARRRKPKVAGLTVVKIGGSLITKKGQPFVPDLEAMVSLASELHRFLEAKGGADKLVIVHGGGGYAHTVADTYRHQLRNMAELDYGFLLIAWALNELNRRLMKTFIDFGIRALPLELVGMITASSGELTLNHPKIIEGVIRRGWTPVLHGGVLLDVEDDEPVLISGEDVMCSLAKSLPVKRTLVLTDQPGVLARQEDPHSTIPRIDPQRPAHLMPELRESRHRDVTGGMAHKVEVLAKIAKECSVPSLIISGRVRGNLLRGLMGRPVRGTWIR